MLLENIKSSKSIITSQLRNVEQDIIKTEADLRRLPKEEQELAEIERRFSLSQEAVNLSLIHI